ncbi:catenin delta-2 isoform X2 [Parasteatoda tepidariorum]|uniref:catenin delta-2 isoform X2 n=1 Tax=Parasteatoda tepidariorum TaxID=114398 RepID=UPI001C7245C7|nr:catenin delta-2 isoform X2 [Parasteatoda tepidariorum]
MTEPHMHYYPDHGTSLPDYLQEGIPEVQESYSMSYQTSTSTNGHHGDVDASSNNSQSSVPVDNASLISRSTSETKTQQVKTVTKIIKTREVHHIGPPDGKAISCSPYGTKLPPGSDYLPYNYPGNHEYGTYDPGRPPSPAGQTPTQVYASDYATYARTASPASTGGRNFEIYSPSTCQPYSNYAYQSVATPSGASDSPNLHRAMPQAPRSVATDYNHQPGNYEEIDGAALVPRFVDYRRTPSPTQSADRYGTYGYSATIPATSPGYHQYDPALPQGYLDRRPSFDEHPQSQLSASTYGVTKPRSGYEEENIPLVAGESIHAVPSRHPHLDYTPVDNQSSDVRFRDPDVHEVIEFLSHPNNIVRANAAAYLQHLCYMNDNMKQKARALGAIPPLIELFNQDIPEIQRNACGALRNISYGRQNDENKRAIKNADGIPALVRLLRKTPDNEIRELVTGILWNLSSCEDLKRPIIDDALNVLVNHVIIPQSGYDRNIPNIFLHEIKPNEIYWSTVFRNASGVLRNVSSAGEYARKKLRSCEGLIEAMVYLVRSAIGKNDIDTNCVENCVCVLRNLSYRLQEIEDPDYDKHLYPTSMQSRASAPLKAVGDHLGCFGGTNKKKKDATEKERREAVPLTKNPISESDPASGFALLWQPEVAQLYISLLTECSNPETLEAAAGAIMNLAACYWEPSIDIRATVRKEKGLPILVELLRMDCDRVVGSVAGALRNLSSDARNRDLIGNYALKDLLLKLPNGSPQHDSGTSDDTIAAVLGTLNEVIAKQTDFARSFLQLGGVERLNQIVQQKGTYSPRVVKFASQLLYNMWQNTELRDAYLKAGFKESHFVPKSIAVRNSLSSPTGANSTLNRPVSTQGGTKYEDRTLPHGTELNSTAASIPYSRSEELPLSELSHSTEPPSQSQAHRPHMGVFPPGMEQARSPADPVYAQVNKRRNKEQRTHSDLPKQQLLTNDQPDGMPAGDSWV